MRKRWYCALAVALVLGLTACSPVSEPSPPPEDSATLIPTHAPTPSPENTPVPVPPTAAITLTSKIEDGKATDALETFENDVPAIHVVVALSNVTDANSFKVVLSSPDLQTTASPPVDLAVDGDFDYSFDAPASGWIAGEYVVSVLQTGDDVALAEKRFQITEPVGPVVNGTDYLPAANQRIRGYWVGDDEPDGNWYTARLEGRPYEGYLVSQVSRENTTYIRDYYLDGDRVMMCFSDTPDAPIEYLPAKVRPGMEWTTNDEKLAIVSVDASFTVRGTAYENCIELTDTVTKVDEKTSETKQSVLHQIYAPKVGLIYEWSEPDAQDKPTYYVKSAEAVAEGDALDVFKKVPGLEEVTAAN